MVVQVVAQIQADFGAVQAAAGLKAGQRGGHARCRAGYAEIAAQVGGVGQVRASHQRQFGAWHQGEFVARRVVERGAALAPQHILAPGAAQRELAVDVIDHAQTHAQGAAHIGQAAQQGFFAVFAPAVNAQ